MTESFKYKAFISYSHADEARARWLHKALETYRIPKPVVVKHGLHSNRLGAVFRDREDLASAGSLSKVIREALAESENLVVICSADAARSEWVNAEVTQFKAMGKASRVFCVLFGDPQESFPPAALVDVDGDGVATAEETEPLAADARPEGGGRVAAKIKVVAGLLGLGLDEIRRRETQRRQQRIGSVVAGALAGMAGAMALAIWALLAEQEAQTQRVRAEREAAVSEEVTAYLVGLFDNSNPFRRDIEASGTLTARELLDRGVGKVDSELADRPIVQARVLAAIGSSYRAYDDEEEGDRLLRKSIAILEASDDDSTKLSLAKIYTDLGQSIGHRDSKAALEALRRALDLRESELGREHPDVAQSLFVLGKYHSNDNLSAAEELIREAIVIMERADPDNRDLPSALNFLGLMLSYQDRRAAEAVQLIDRSIELHERHIRPGKPASLGYAGQLMNAATVYMAEGLRLENAGEDPTKYFAKALETYERILAAYEDALAPDHPMLGLGLWGVAVAESSLGHYEEAETLFRRALAVLEPRNPADWSLPDLLIDYADHKQRQGSFHDAERLLERALTTARAHVPVRIEEVEDRIRRLAEARNPREVPDDAHASPKRESTN